MNQREAERLFQAFETAQLIGAPLNVAVTIQWAMCVNWEDEHQRLKKWSERVRKWLERRGSVYASVWVMESNTPTEMLHSHILLHIPEDLIDDFRSYAVAATGGDAQDIGESYAVLVKECGPPFGAKGMLKYMLKTLKVEDALALGMRRKEGRAKMGVRALIDGKRCGYSKPIGPKARSHWKFQLDGAR